MPQSPPASRRMIRPRRMNICVRPNLLVITPSGRKCLPEPCREPFCLAPSQDAPAAINSHSIRDCGLALLLHIGNVLPIPFCNSAKIVQDHLPLSKPWISIHRKIDWRIGSLPDGLCLRECAPSIVLSLGLGKVRHVGGVALFEATHD